MLPPFRPSALAGEPPFRFEPVDPGRKLAVATPEQVRSFNERGFFVWKGAFEPAELAPLVADLDRAIERSREAARRAGGRIFISHADGIVFAPHVVRPSKAARRIAAHPRIAGLCADLLGPEVRLYWDQAVYKHPSFPEEFPWHQDNGYTFVWPELYLTIWLALSDATPENGCVEVMPASHLEGTREHRAGELGWWCHRGDDGLCAPLAAGSALVFSSLTVHRTGPNRTRDDVRKTYILQYAPDGVVAHPRGGPPARCDDPERQFFVVRGGKPVPPPA